MAHSKHSLVVSDYYFLANFSTDLGEGNGTPLQCSCLENPMDGGAWKATVHGVAEGRTRLSDFTFTHWRREWHPTPVFLPGESQGRGSLWGCSPWGLEESDTTERLHFYFSLSCTGVVLKKVSRGLSRVEAGNPGFPRLVQVTSGASHGGSEKPGKLEVGGASRDSTGLGALEEGLISS